MTAILSSTHPHSSTGATPCNAVRIVEPHTGTVVGAAVDSRSAHPLHHAAMCALEAAAQWDRQAWPAAAADDDHHTAVADQREREECVPLTATAHVVAVSAATGLQAAGKEDGLTSGNHGCVGASGCYEGGNQKRQRISGGQESACLQPRHSSEQTHRSLDQQQQQQQPTQTHQAQQTKKQSQPQQQAQDLGLSKPYMCTGYDCFIAREPCIMCAMALVSFVVNFILCVR